MASFFSIAKSGFNATTYAVRDIWAKKAVGTTDKIFATAVPAHDVIVLRLTNAEMKNLKKSKK